MIKIQHEDSGDKVCFRKITTYSQFTKRAKNVWSRPLYRLQTSVLDQKVF